MPQPNLFNYATSELSQDAFFSWLIAWADEDCSRLDSALHKTAVSFVRALFAAAGVDSPPDSVPVRVKTQEHRVDIVAYVGDGHAILIEDKVHTREHSNQLERYRERFAKDHPKLKVAYVYLKTGDQGSYAEVQRSGWGVMRRQDLLEVLGVGGGRVENPIFTDFLEYLKQIDADVKSFREEEPGKWSPAAWGGFFTELQKTIPDGRWGYVANPTGGFMGFWWGWWKVDGAEVYLQLEEERLVARVSVDDEEENPRLSRRELRQGWSQRISSISSPRFVPPTAPGVFIPMSYAKRSMPLRGTEP